MRIFAAALFALLAAGCSARRPVAEASPTTLLATPLSQTLGEEEAGRIRAMAEVNGMLRHCRLRWEGYFGRMTAQQEELGRSREQMQRIAVWHGYWLGNTERAANRDQIPCPSDFQTALRDRGEGLLRMPPAR